MGGPAGAHDERVDTRYGEVTVRPASSGYVLESIASDLGTTPEEVLNGFLGRTRLLSPGEQAEVLGAMLEDAPPVTRSSAPTRPTPPPQQRPGSPPPQQRPGGPQPQRPGGSQPQPQRPGGSQPQPRPGGDFFASFGRVAGGFQQGLGFFTQGAQAISSIASLFGGGAAQDVSRVAGQLSQGGSQVDAMLRGLRGGQVSLPGAAGGGAAAAGQFDATALLQMLMSNPQLQRALRSASVLGEDAERAVELHVPSARGARAGATTVSIPLSAVVSTVAELASRSAAELEASLPAHDTEYLASEGGALLVDPEQSESRAGLVLHYFRIAGEAERFGEAGLDESEVWANEAGFS